MPQDNANTGRHGGPGSSHQNQQDPSKSSATGRKGGGDNSGPEAGSSTNPDHSRVSGGGGERDRNHTHDPDTKH
ncbi:hypothetical protein ACFOD4_00275 [Pseudoroseomonas globiformis]|uniref:Uncharacterized protein n=1 Tax=Teichococcus globiformis TaxID=2307229 RepID=A0ABV7FT05_9PROT